MPTRKRSRVKPSAKSAKKNLQGYSFIPFVYMAQRNMGTSPYGMRQKLSVGQCEALKKSIRLRLQGKSASLPALHNLIVAWEGNKWLLS